MQSGHPTAPANSLSQTAPKGNECGLSIFKDGQIVPPSFHRLFLNVTSTLLHLEVALS